jgi:polyphosphate glucokinase
MQESQYVLGIDVGASGIKGAIVDLEKGELIAERIRLETPRPATPKAVAATFSKLVKLHDWQGPIGCGFPSIVKHGVAQSAANISKDWIGQDVASMLSNACNLPVEVLNDADAAGLAEMRFGLGQDESGVVLLVTIGSGLGSALFLNGQLIPNTEFGHLKLKGKPIEHYASNNARKRDSLAWHEWGERFNEFLHYVNRIVNPDLILLGGGISKKFEKYEEHIVMDIPVKPAKLLNAAGTIGAAMYAYEKQVLSASDAS